jgi:hypothetical protein
MHETSHLQRNSINLSALPDQLSQSIYLASRMKFVGNGNLNRAAAVS